jgi:hypothetical protein
MFGYKQLPLITADVKKTVFDVKMYGAKGDGLTDDTAAIEAAITALDAASGGALYFPAGTYIVGNIACVDNMEIYGVGWASIIKLKDGASSPCNCIAVTGVTNVSIHDLQLDGNRENNQTTGLSADSNWNCIKVTGSTNVRIQNVWAHSAGYHGVIMLRASLISISHSRFNDNGFRPFHGHEDVVNCNFSHNLCYDNGKGFTGEPTPYDGIYFFDGIENITIQGNRITSSNGNGCIIVAGIYNGTKASKHISILGNVCTSGSTASVHGITLIGTDLRYVNIVGNVIHNSRFGIYGSIATEAVGSDIIIANNTIHNCSKGVSLQKDVARAIIKGNTMNTCPAGAIYATNLTDSIISENIMINCGAWTPNFDAINLSGASLRNIISNNRFSNTQAGHYSAYGINEIEDSDYNYIHDNFYYQMATGDVNKTGVNTVVRNDDMTL